MGYAVLHLAKASGTDSAMSAHIERTIAPKNADAELTYLNRELIEFPEEVSNRTEAIQHRLDTADLQRKIGKNQVRAIRVLLTGSPKEMKQIEDNGQLDQWCNDNLKWLSDTYGSKNLVSAVLHLDETTPHIHATIVPIVTGERRKKKSEEKQDKKKYRKKSSSNSRLCADDVMSRVKLKEYQNSYAEVMNRYGLQRGIEGSKAKHVSTSKYYRDLVEETKDIKSEVIELQEQKTQAKQELSKVKGDIKGEKLKSVAVDVGTTFIEGVGSLLGTSKVRKQGKQIEVLHSMLEESKNDNSKLQRKISTVISNFEKEINNIKGNYQNEINEVKEFYEQKESELRRENSEYKTIFQRVLRWFPLVKEVLKMEELCKSIGFSTDYIPTLLTGKEITFSGDLYSEEHNTKFSTQDSKIRVSQDKGKLFLVVDHKLIKDWFKEKWEAVSQSLERRNVNNRSKGFRM